MAEMHSYATNSRRQATILGAIALASAFAAIGTYYSFEWISARLKPQLDIQAFGWLIGPLTLTGYYAIFLAIFEKYSWRALSETPHLGGTWVGCTRPDYQGWPHLSVLKIEQTWLTIFVELSHFWRGKDDTEWNLSRRLGRDQSVTAALSSRRVNEANFTFCYQHKGIKADQPDFDGTMSLIVDLAGKQLQGKYYTNRPFVFDERVCSYGHVMLVKQSDKLLSAEESLKSFVGDEQLLQHIVEAVANMAGREPNYRLGSHRRSHGE